MKLAEGTVAWITGAARGLGWGIARAFARAGARVCVTDVNDDELARCAADLDADGAQFLTRASDASDPAACMSVARMIVERWGRLDVVVHNAIYMPLQALEATAPEDWARQIAVGLGGFYNCTRAAWAQMKTQGGGHLMGVASGSSLRGYKDEVAYCAIKHGI